jgi:Kef-type K+ transport system membrane component KefB
MIALAFTTTALGMLSPMLRDARELETGFGRMVLAAGAVGEFGPIVGMSIAFAREYSDWQQAGLILAFVALTLLTARAALGLRPPRLLALLSRTMHSSAQLPVLLSLLLLAGFTVLGKTFGLEAVCGAFAAGMVMGLATPGEDGKPLRQKIEAICYGFFVPFFFVVSGMRFDLGALLDRATAMLLVPLFLVFFLIVRGLPVWLYRSDLARGELLPFVLYTSMGLPVILAITSIGVETGRMSTEIAAALVGAGILSVLFFPTIAGTLRAGAMPPASRR